jgi:excisionase family DNA binding protein
MLKVWCENCNRATKLLNIKEACALMTVCRRTIYNWIENGRLHLYKNAGDRTLICEGSLLRPYEKGD